MSSIRSMTSTRAEDGRDEYLTRRGEDNRRTSLDLVAGSVESEVLVHRTDDGGDGGSERSRSGVRDVSWSRGTQGSEKDKGETVLCVLWDSRETGV
jgi:hypothetical protein